VCGATLVETPAIESLPEGKTESADSTFWLRSGRPENAATPLDAVRSQRTTHGYRLLKKALAEKFDLPDFPPAETQSFYQNFAPGEAATRTVVYLNAAAGEHTRSAVQSGEIYLVGSDGNKSAYVLFTGTSGQGWVSPNPQRSSLEATSQGVSERARELLARGRADIQMVLVERISDDHQAAATKALMPLAGDPVVHQTAPSCGRTGIRHYWKGHHLTLIIQLRL
jgi:hypothetical protein